MKDATVAIEVFIPGLPKKCVEFGRSSGVQRVPATETAGRVHTS